MLPSVLLLCARYPSCLRYTEWQLGTSEKEKRQQKYIFKKEMYLKVMISIAY